MTDGNTHTSDPDSILDERERSLLKRAQGTGAVGGELESDELSALLAAVKTAASEEEATLVGKIRRWSTTMRALVALLLMGLVVAFTATALPRPDLAVYPTAYMATIVVVMSVLVISAVRVALAPFQASPISRSRLVLWIVLGGLIAPLILAGLPPAHAAHAASVEGAGADMMPRAIQCFGFGSMIAIPMLIVMRILDRGGQLSWWRGAFAALAAGFVGDLALQMHCPITHESHLLLGHATVVVAILAVYGTIQWFWPAPPLRS